MKVYIAVAKSCDSCGGDMRVIVRTSQPSLFDVAAISRDAGFCAITQTFEVEVDGDEVIVNMNPSRGY